MFSKNRGNATAVDLLLRIQLACQSYSIHFYYAVDKPEFLSPSFWSKMMQIIKKSLFRSKIKKFCAKRKKKSILPACAQHKTAIISEIKFQLQPFTTKATALTTFFCKQFCNFCTCTISALHKTKRQSTQ